MGNILSPLSLSISMALVGFLQTFNSAISADGSAAPSSTVSDSYIAQATERGVIHWSANRMPIKVCIQPGTSVHGYRPEFAKILKESFEAWAEASAGVIKVAFVDAPASADMVCGWTQDQNKMTSRQENGHTVVIPDAQGIVHADILLLTVPPASMASIPDNYERRTALHEVGHALGISGHSPTPSDVMYGTINAVDKTVSLTERDKNTLKALYASIVSLPESADIPLPAGSSPELQAMRLNNEAAAALNKGQLEEARSKFVEAHKLDPKNALINGNLGSMYMNYAVIAMMKNQPAAAEKLFAESIPMLKASPNKSAYQTALQNYSNLLKMQNKAAEAAKVDAELKQAQGK